MAKESTEMTREPEDGMTDINAALAASKEAIQQLIASGERCGPAWAAPPRAWEVVAQSDRGTRRALAEESANMAAGRPSKFPTLPALVHPLVRAFLFRRVLRNGAFPKARTNKAMNPRSGPATAAEGRVRLEAAHEKFAAACRLVASRDTWMRTTIFGMVPVVDYVRFTELHTRHHDRQMAAQ